MSVRTNLFNNPSGRRTTTGYVLLSGTIGQDAGRDTYNVVPNGTNLGNAGIVIESPVVGAGKLLPNTTYTYSAYIYASFGKAELFVGGAGVTAGVTGTPTTGFARSSVTFTTSAAGVVNFYVLNATIVPSTGSNVVAFFDALLEVGAVLGAYLDGTYPGAVWAGPADNSASTQYIPVVTLTAATDPNPSPRVRIDVTSLPADADVTIHRYADEKATVMGAVKVFSGGSFTVVDYLVPRGVTVTYIAEWFDPATGASLGLSEGAAVLIPGDSSTAWFSDPLMPGNAVEVMMGSAFAEKLTRGRSMELHRVGTRTVALMGPPGKLSGVNLRCYTLAEADTAMLRDVIAGGTVVIRTAPPVALPRVLYGALASVDEVGVNIHLGMETTAWDVVGDEISPLELDIAVPVVTWQNYVDAFPTWTDYNAAYLTWFDAMRNPPGA